MANAHRATLMILHAIVPLMPFVPEQYLNTAIWDDVDRRARRVAEQRLRAMVTTAKESGVRTVGLIFEREAAPQIGRAIRTKRADLLVVGTHGRGGLAKFFVGSVASRVVATTSCPVVIVRG